MLNMEFRGKISETDIRQNVHNQGLMLFSREGGGIIENISPTPRFLYLKFFQFYAKIMIS